MEMDIEEEEQEDIYFDLPQYDLGTENAKLRTENDAYKSAISILEAKLASLEIELSQLRELRDREKQILTVNISELYKTAKAENERKDRTIDELRRQLDNFIFRRDKGNIQHKRLRDEEQNEEVAAKRLKESDPVRQETGHGEKQESLLHHEKDVKPNLKDKAPKNENRPRSRSREVHRKRHNGEKSRSSSKDRKKEHHNRHRDERKNGTPRDHHKREVSPTSHRSTPEALRHIQHKNGRRSPEKDRSTRRETDTQKSSTRKHCDSKHHDRLSDVNIFKGLVVVDDKASIPKRIEKSAKERLKENSRHDKSRSSSSSSSKRSQKSDSNTKPNDSKKEMPRSDRSNEKVEDSLPDLRQKLNVLTDKPKDRTHHEVKPHKLIKRKEDIIALNENSCHAEIETAILDNGAKDSKGPDKTDHEKSSSVKVIKRLKKTPSPKKQTTVQKAFANLKIQRDKIKRDEWRCSDVLNDDESQVRKENVEELQESLEEGEIIDDHKSSRMIEEPNTRAVEQRQKKDARLEEQNGKKANEEKKRKGVNEAKDKRVDEGEAVEHMRGNIEESNAREVEKILRERENAGLKEHKGETVEREQKQRSKDEPKRRRVNESEAVKGQKSLKLEEYKNRRREESARIEKSKKTEERIDERLKEYSVEKVEEKLERLVEQTGEVAIETAGTEKQMNDRAEEDIDKNIEDQLRGILEGPNDRKVEESEAMKNQKSRTVEECQRREYLKGDNLQKQEAGTLDGYKLRKIEVQKDMRVEKQNSERVEKQNSERVEKQNSRRVEEQHSRRVEEQNSRRAEEQNSRRVEEQNSRSVQEQKGRKIEEQKGERVIEHKSGLVEENVRVKEQNGGRHGECERRDHRRNEKLQKQKDGTLEEQKSRRVDDQKRGRMGEQRGERVKDQKSEEGLERRKEDKMEKRQEKRKEKPKQEKVERKESMKEAQIPDIDDDEYNLENRQIEALLAQRKFELEMLQKKSENTEKNRSLFGGSLISPSSSASQVVDVSQMSDGEKKTLEENTGITKQANNGDEGRLQQALKESRSQDKPKATRSEIKSSCTRPEENRSVVRPRENPKATRSEEKPRVTRPEEKSRVTRPEEKPRIPRSEEKPQDLTVRRPQEKPKSAFRRNIEAVTKDLFSAAEKESTEPEEFLSERNTPVAPKQSVLESFLNFKDKNESNDHRKSKSLFDTPCKAIVDANKPEFREPKKERRKSDPTKKRRSKDGNDGLLSTAEKERDKPEELLSVRSAPAPVAPKQSVPESILNNKEMNESNDHRKSNLVFDTPCRTIVDANKPEFQEPKKERRKPDPIKKRRSKDGIDASGPATIGEDNEEPPRRVLRSQTKAMRASPTVPKPPLSSSPIKKLEPEKPQKPYNMLFQDLNISDVHLNPEDILTYDLSHDGAIPCLHISDSFNNVQLETYGEIARNFNDVVASTPINLTAEQMRSQLKEDLGTSSSSDSKLTPDLGLKTTKVQCAQKQLQPTSSVPGSNVSNVRRRRRCIVTLVD